MRNAATEGATEATPEEIEALLAGVGGLVPEKTPEQLSEEAAQRFDGDLAERFRRAREARRGVEAEMRESMYRREGKYSPRVESVLAKGRASRAFNNITEHKAAAAEANISKVVFSPTRSWGMEPTPIPELSPAAKARVQAEVERQVGPAQEALMEQFAALADEVRAGEAEGYAPTREQMARDVDIKSQLADLQEQARAVEEAAEAAEREATEKEAAKRAERMQKLIDDQLAEGGYENAMREMICDFCTYEIAGLMGPFPQISRKRVVEEDPATGVWGVRWEDEVRPVVMRMDPWGIFPAPLANGVEDGDFFYRVLITDDAAVELFNAPNVLRDRVSKAYKLKGARLDEETAANDQPAVVRKEPNAEGESHDGDGMHELVYWWHKMTRREAAGIAREELQADADPEERAGYMGLMLNGVVISIHPNWDPTGRPQVHLCSYRRRSGSIFGRSLPWLNRDAQNVRNIAVRGLLTNLLYSASPSFLANMDLLENPADILSIYPGKVFQAAPSHAPGDNRRAIEALQVPNFTGPMLSVANQAGVWGDDATGIYPAAYGDARQQGAAETMGGYRMIREDQNIMMQLALYNIDAAQKSLVRALWLWNMLAPGHEDCRGDMTVVTRGIMQLFINNENVNACAEKLQLFATNERAAAHLKDNGYLKLLRMWLTLSNQDPDEIVVTEEELAARIQQQQEQAEAEAQAQAEAEERARAEVEGQAQPGEAAPGNGEPPAKPESESDRIRAQADMMRAQAAMRKAETEEGKLVLARAREARSVREAQTAARKARASAPKVQTAIEESK